MGIFDRGREGRQIPTSPPSEPDWRVSRIRLSSQWATFMRLACTAMGLVQRIQADSVKEGVGPALMIRTFGSPSLLLPFAQQASQPSTQPAVQA